MLNKSALQMKSYSVEEIRFKGVPHESTEHKFELYPKFNHQLTERGDNKYDYMLSVSIMPTNEVPAPFELYVAVTGHFTWQESEDDPIDAKVKDTILNKNTAAILFPFLRSIVSAVTVNANKPALILPIFSFMGKEPDKKKS